MGMLKRYCDICKVELDEDEKVKEVKLPNKNLKVCISCIKALEQHREIKQGRFTLIFGYDEVELEEIWIQDLIKSNLVVKE